MKPVAAIDLDGTLLDTNTFVDYTRFSIKESIKSLRPDIAITIAWHVALRKLRFTPHRAMKHGILRATNQFMNKQRLSKLSLLLIAKQNTKVITEIEQLRSQGYYLCLATAAPQAYAQLVASHFNLDYCIATPRPGDNWEEYFGQVKLDNLMQHLNQNKLSLQVVITDHHDDLPLLQACQGRKIIVNPSQKTQSRLTKALGRENFEII